VAYARTKHLHMRACDAYYNTAKYSVVWQFMVIMPVPRDALESVKSTYSFCFHLLSNVSVNGKKGICLV
jgi:hypothetical protein